MNSTVIKCPHCAVEIELDGPGRFACFSCGGGIEAGGERHVNAPPIQPTAVSMQRWAEKLKRNRGTGWWTVVRAIAWVIFLGPGFLIIAVGVAMDLSGEANGTFMSGVSAVMAFVPILIGWLLESVGRSHSTETVCGACGNPVGKHATLCPTCRVGSG